MRENTFYFPPPFFFGTEFTNIAFLILNFGYDRDSINGNFSFYDWLALEKQVDTLDRKEFMILSPEFDYLDPIIQQALPSSGNAGSCIAEG